MVSITQALVAKRRNTNGHSYYYFISGCKKNDLFLCQMEVILTTDVSGDHFSGAGFIVVGSSLQLNRVEKNTRHRQIQTSQRVENQASNSIQQQLGKMSNIYLSAEHVCFHNPLQGGFRK